MGSPGRPPGAKGKAVQVRTDLVEAWHVAAGPQTALKLMRSAIDQALARDSDGKPTGEKPDWEPLRTILPYVARKLPEGLEIQQLDPLSHLSDEELIQRIVGARK